jgi:hypothetical protein
MRQLAQTAKRRMLLIQKLSTHQPRAGFQPSTDKFSWSFFYSFVLGRCGKHAPHPSCLLNPYPGGKVPVSIITIAAASPVFSGKSGKIKGI